jgi:hypothetical protein
MKYFIEFDLNFKKTVLSVGCLLSRNSKEKKTYT